MIVANCEMYARDCIKEYRQQSYTDDRTSIPIGSRARSGKTYAKKIKKNKKTKNKNKKIKDKKKERKKTTKQQQQKRNRIKSSHVWSIVCDEIILIQSRRNFLWFWLVTPCKNLLLMLRLLYPNKQ